MLRLTISATHGDWKRVYNGDIIFDRHQMEGERSKRDLRSDARNAGGIFIFGKDAVWMATLNQEEDVYVDGRVLVHGAVKMAPGYKKNVQFKHVEFWVEVADIKEA